MVMIMDKNDFAKRLADLRTAKGVSARDMSLSLGQSAGYINKIPIAFWNIVNVILMFFIGLLCIIAAVL